MMRISRTQAWGAKGAGMISVSRIRSSTSRTGPISPLPRSVSTMTRP
ncbi:hypothetical protein [Novosphingobium humi]|nr:hypothetical protein [Novosphingobium humi]WJT01102.1 hypothetical protein NYQ05_16655 [Novosphingobium humi]